MNKKLQVSKQEEQHQMTNPETKAQYEGAILQQLIKNAEELAVIKPQVNKIEILEQKIDQIYSAISFVKWLSITIFIGYIYWYCH